MINGYSSAYRDHDTATMVSKKGRSPKCISHYDSLSISDARCASRIEQDSAADLGVGLLLDRIANPRRF